MSRCDVSVLVVNWNTRDLVLECLDSLPQGVGDDVTIETIVVDNGSTDGSLEALGERDDILLIANEENLGFAAAVNQGHRRATGEFVLLLNSDVELSPRSLGTLVSFLHEHPAIVGAAPLYLNPDGSSQPFHFRLPTFGMLLINGSSLIRCLYPGSARLLQNYRMSGEDFSHPRPVPQPSASCLLLRASYLPEDAIMDEAYPIFFNDVKLALTLANRGLELWVVPNAVVYHEAHSSAKRLGSAAGRRQFLGSVVRYLSETQPPTKVWLYRAVVLFQNTILWILRRPEALHGADLRRALAGDPGLPPRNPTG